MKMWKALKKNLLPLAALCMFWCMAAVSAQAASKADLPRDIKGRYVIRNVEDLNIFRASLETDAYKDETVILAADIDCSKGLKPLTYTPDKDTNLGAGWFAGYFNGNGYTIRNYNDGRWGLFPILGAANSDNWVTNLAISVNAVIENPTYGVFCNYYKGKHYIIRCSLEGKLSYNYAPGSNKGETLICIGGYVGYVDTDDDIGTQIGNCLSAVDISLNVSDSTDNTVDCRVSGLVGGIRETTTRGVNSMYCLYTGTIHNEGSLDSLETQKNKLSQYSQGAFLAGRANITAISKVGSSYLYYDSRLERKYISGNADEYKKLYPLSFADYIYTGSISSYKAKLGLAVTPDDEQSQTTLRNNLLSSWWTFPSTGYPYIKKTESTELQFPAMNIALKDNQRNLIMKTGDSQKLEVEIMPENALSNGLQYTSDQDTVATVTEDGTVTAVGEGTANITVELKEYTDPAPYDGYVYPKVTCRVTVVKDIPAEKVSVSPEKLELNAGETKELKVTVTPDSATDKTWKCTSDKPEIATAAEKDGKVLVTAMKAGTATITVTANGGDGVSATCQVTVIKKEPSTETPPAEGPGTTEPGKPGIDQPSSSDTPSTGDQGQTEPSAEPSTEKPQPQPVKVGAKATVQGNVYKITAKSTVAYQSPKNKKAKVTVPDKVTIKGKSYKVTSVAANAFKNNKKLTQVTIGKNITSIGANAFSGCTKLSAVSIGAKVTAIGKGAFQNCRALKNVTIGKNITSIGANAFYGCRNLKKVTIKSTKLKASSIGNNAFKGIYVKATVKVPSAKLKAYRALLQKKGVGKKAVIKK